MNSFLSVFGALLELVGKKTEPTQSLLCHSIGHSSLLKKSNTTESHLMLLIYIIEEEEKRRLTKLYLITSSSSADFSVGPDLL